MPGHLFPAITVRIRLQKVMPQPVQQAAQTAQWEEGWVSILLTFRGWS